MTHRFSPVVIPTLAIALTACAVDAPTAPGARAPAGQAQSLAVSGEPLNALRGTVSDARVRLVPAIGDAGVQSRLGGALSRVSDALAADDAGALAESLGAARTALNAEMQALGADSPAAPDLDALALALDGVSEALPAHMRSQ
ncbi:MAG TPA: hypothetical protein VFY65_15835 [Longimicrobium sp.]|nr:hypothetical protein [Longimicrobium sp.]